MHKDIIEPPRLNTTSANNPIMEMTCTPNCTENTEKPTPASVQHIYDRLSSCYDKVSRIRRKLEFLIEGKGEFPDDNIAYPQQANPTMPVIREVGYDIEQQLILCNQLVDVLKDGGHLK